MAAILKFPIANASSWSAWERIYRDAATQASWPKDMTEAIVARMKAHHDRIAAPSPVMFALPKLENGAEQSAVDEAVAHGIRQVENAMASITDELFVQIFDLEIALYRAKLGD